MPSSTYPRRSLRHLILLVVAGLLGSCSTDSTNPNRFSLAPSELAHLRAQQSVSMRNAYQAPAPSKALRLTFDQKQLTDTAIAMLTRAMEKHGIAVAAEAEKTVTLRVRLAYLRMHGVAPVPQRTARIYLDAALGDGTSTSLEGEESSYGEFDRAIDGAIFMALKDLVADEKFVAYMKR
jgi:hypothetical protein